MFSLNKFLASGVGSLPHLDPKDACSLIFKHFSRGVPYWPQLPKISFKESMYVQYSQGLPGVVIDEGRKRIYIDTAAQNYSAQVESAYEHYLSSDTDYFAISRDYAAGFYEFLNQLSPFFSYPLPAKRYPLYIKGQIIGPVSFGLTVFDQDKKSVIYNTEFSDCLIKVLTMKALWQIKKIREVISYQLSIISKKQKITVNPGPEIIIFIDEPYLVSLGSSYFNIGAQEIIKMLNEIIGAIHNAGAYVGLHCCGNTDWPVLLSTDIDILNFDAYEYLEPLLLYKNELNDFKKKKKVLAYGAVPTFSDKLLPEADILKKKIISAGCPAGGLITPACGLSGVSLERADEILGLVSKIAGELNAPRTL